MNTQQVEKTVYRIQPEIVILDSDELIILLAQAQANHQKQGDTSEVISWLEAGNGAIPFVMFIDLEKIQIFKWDGNNCSEPILSLSTADVLSHYEPNFSSKKIYSLYLKTLAEAWISDISKHWKLATPPASKEMAEIGLLQLLKDGTTQVYY